MKFLTNLLVRFAYAVLKRFEPRLLRELTTREVAKLWAMQEVPSDLHNPQVKKFMTAFNEAQTGIPALDDDPDRVA